MDFLSALFPQSPLFAADTLRVSVILLTLKVAGIATVVSSVLGILTAWCIARRPFPGRTWVDALCALLGPWLAEFGINLMFSWEGAVVAATVVVFPLIYKSARAALEAVDHNLENAARTLGASEWKVFLRVSLPLAWRGILAGVMLAFARGMGEFGATLMIAGNLPGRTQTLSLAIYSAFQAGDDAQALALVIVTSLLCMGVLILADKLATGGLSFGRGA